MKSWQSPHKNSFFSEYPIGDPFGGPAYNKKEIPAAVLAVVSSVVGVASAINQYQQGQKAEKAQKQAQAMSQRQSEAEAQRERIKQAREARIRRARILAATGTEGGGASQAAAAVSSVTSQEASNIGHINVIQDFSRQISAYNQKALNAQSKAQTWGTIGNLAGDIFNMADGPGQVKDYYNKNKKVTIGGG